MRLNVEEAIKVLLDGEVIGIVTDTVLGFAALKESSEKIYEIKGREKNKPLIQMVHPNYIFPQTNPEIKTFMDESWPGNITIIYPIDGIQTSFRIPNEKTLLELFEKINVAVYTTSANVSGEDPCQSIEEFEQKFPNIPILEPQYENERSNIASSIYIYEEKFRRIR